MSNSRLLPGLLRLFLWGALLMAGLPSFALRLAPVHLDNLVANADFIFIGQVLRVQSFKGSSIGMPDEQYTVMQTRMLRGKLPKTVVLRGSAVRPNHTASLFIFFAKRVDPAFIPKGMDPATIGFDAYLEYGDIQPLSELKATENLINHPEKISPSWR